jgi:O-antigen/teichoic acid export membrane protein
MNSIGTGIASLLVIPFYIKHLGQESYGLIGFLAGMQSMLVLFDLGLSATINREAARTKALSDTGGFADVLHSLAVVYWVFSGLILLLFVMMSKWLARHWFISTEIGVEDLALSVGLMGLVLACRWPIAMYQGALSGSGHLKLVSQVNLIFVTLSTAGAVLVLSKISAQLSILFAYLASVSLVQSLTLRWLTWGKIDRKSTIKFSWKNVRSLLKSSISLGVIAGMGLLMSQTDKLILSKTLHLSSYGQYMQAVVFVSALYMLVIPAYNTFYPVFASLFAKNDMLGLQNNYINSSIALSKIMYPLAMVIGVLCPNILQAWLGNTSDTELLTFLVRILLVAVVLHSVMFLPYALLQAVGMAKAMLPVYLCLIVVCLPMTIYASSHFGVKGAAMAQLILFSCYLLMGIYATHRNIFPNLLAQWVVKVVLLPTVITGVVFACVVRIQYVYSLNITALLVLSIFAGLVNMSILFCSDKRLAKSSYFYSNS